MTDAGHPCRQGFWLAQGAKATLVSCKGRKSRFLLLARAQNKTASGEALLPCLRELPHLAVPTDALGGKAFPAGTEAGFPGVLTYLRRPQPVAGGTCFGGVGGGSGCACRGTLPCPVFFHALSELQVCNENLRGGGFSGLAIW